MAAHAAHVPSLGLSGDQGQRVTITTHMEQRAWSGGLTGQIIDQTTHWADEFLLPQDRCPTVPAAAPPPAPTQSVHTVPPELNPNAVAVWRLTCCKRFGDPLLSFVRSLLPKVAGELTAMPSHPGT